MRTLLILLTMFSTTTHPMQSPEDFDRIAAACSKVCTNHKGVRVVSTLLRPTCTCNDGEAYE